MMNNARLSSRHAGRRRRRARLSAGARLCAEPRPGPRRPAQASRRADHPPSRRAADAADDARATRRCARSPTSPPAAIDRARARNPTLGSARGSKRASDLLIPIVKAWCTRSRLSKSLRSASRSMAAWASSRRPARRSIYRDARIAPIYEGTNGIQANDLVGRKLVRDNGAAMRDFIAEMRTLGLEGPNSRPKKAAARRHRRARESEREPAYCPIPCSRPLLSPAPCRISNFSAPSRQVGSWPKPRRRPGM